eukprot:8249494-Pyramimonas_sp.AAC.1
MAQGEHCPPPPQTPSGPAPPPPPPSHLSPSARPPAEMRVVTATQGEDTREWPPGGTGLDA